MVVSSDFIYFFTFYEFLSDQIVLLRFYEYFELRDCSVDVECNFLLNLGEARVCELR